jgi:hypothetical protein
LCLRINLGTRIADQDFRTSFIGSGPNSEFDSAEPFRFCSHLHCT